MIRKYIQKTKSISSCKSMTKQYPYIIASAGALGWAGVILGDCISGRYYLKDYMCNILNNLPVILKS